MREVDRLIAKTKQRGSDINNKDYWFSLETEILDFLNDPDNTEEDKRKLKYSGYTESVYMICRGIEKNETASQK